MIASALIALLSLPLLAGVLYGMRVTLIKQIRTIDQNYTSPNNGPYR